MRPCPGCGATEGVLHADDCSVRPVAFRSCCRTPLYSDANSPHESWCPEWGVIDRPRVVIHPYDHSYLDPWRDTAWT